jgi:serine/threonine protein kinase
LVAVLRVDQRERWQIGEPVPAESYLQDYPALQTDVEHAVELVYAEFLVREEQGEVPTLEEYVARFPRYADRLRIQIELHRALEPGTSLGRTYQTTPRPNPPGSSANDVVANEPGASKWPTLAGYEILGQVGQGGMGVVYKARDRQRGEVVALKTLKRVDPPSLYRFKQEFRALADVVHPNLVTLHELRVDKDDCFFTMEFIEGTDLCTYVRAETYVPVAETSDPLLPCSVRAEAAAGSGARRLPVLSPSVVDRLRDVLPQLAAGLAALHEAGVLHRDLKPSNVLVTPQGRVVLLDFGLSARLDRQGQHHSADNVILGTVAYMAPEQAAALPVSAASDWYSFGVLLYEILTGRPPFQGSALEVLQDKQRIDPPAPCLLAEGVPEDLNALCADLLQRSPAARPTGREILTRLASQRPAAPAPRPAEPTPAGPPLAPGRRVPLVGRKQHLGTLEDAYQAMKQGRTVVLLVHGRSGIGKTSLVEWFLDDLRGRERAVILTGRCYEAESVPFKALDSLMDRLSQHLAQLPEGVVQAVLPRDAASLARVFPAFQRVDAVTRVPGRADAADERELRRRAFGGLRELLARLGDRQPLVLFLDDLQWGDTDSAALLADVLRPPDPPALLLLGAYRSEQAGTSAFLQTFRRTEEGSVSAVDRHELEVAPLTESEARELALSQLTAERPSAAEEPATRARAEAIARESLGSPFFVYELVRHLQVPTSHPEEPSAVRSVRLDDVLWAHVQGLADAARRLMEVVSVAGRPLPLALAGEAAELEAAKPPTTRDAWTALRSGRLIGSARRAGQDVIEPYHDRIRETVVAHLAPDVLRQHHRRLAQVLEATGQADPEALAIHFHGAEEPVRAARYYALGGDQAAEGLAFDHAARLYGLALELGAWPAVEAAALHAKRADALANAGRGPESAEAYLRAAHGPDPARALELRRRAAFQYCSSGRTAEGRAVLRDVLGAVGMSLPGSLWQAVLRLQWYRFRLWLRGLKYRERDAAQVAAEDLHRIDVTWAVTAGLSMIEPVTGAAFQPLNLLLALHAGEPRRLARALAWEAATRSVSGEAGLPRAVQFLELARSLADRLDDPYALGLIHLAGGMTTLCAGRWPSAKVLLEQAGEIFKERCRGVTWERDTADLFLLRVLIMMGEFAELSRLSGPLLKDARERGDVYSALMNGAYATVNVCLAADDAAGARRLVRELLAQWPSEEFNIQRLHALWGETCIDLYCGEGTAAWERLNRVWPLTREPQNVQVIHIWMLSFRARSALAAAHQAGIRELKPLLGAAEADARRLEGTKIAFAETLAQLVRAGIASSRGEDASARQRLTRAAEGFDALAMRSFAAAARRRLGVLLGGEEGRVLVDQADTWMRSQGVRNVARMVAMHAPGFRT